MEDFPSTSLYEYAINAGSLDSPNSNTILRCLQSKLSYAVAGSLYNIPGPNLCTVRTWSKLDVYLVRFAAKRVEEVKHSILTSLHNYHISLRD